VDQSCKQSREISGELTSRNKNFIGITRSLEGFVIKGKIFLNPQSNGFGANTLALIKEKFGRT